MGWMIKHFMAVHFLHNLFSFSIFISIHINKEHIIYIYRYIFLFCFIEAIWNSEVFFILYQRDSFLEYFVREVVSCFNFLCLPCALANFPSFVEQEYSFLYLWSMHQYRLKILQQLQHWRHVYSSNTVQRRVS